MKDYSFASGQLYYKYEYTKSPPCDAYSMHVHDFYELLYFVNGDATCVIEDRRHKLTAGDLVLIRPLRYHFLQIDSPVDYERYDMLFDPTRHGIEGVHRIGAQIEVVHLKENAIAEDIFRRCEFYRRTCDAETFSKLLVLLLNELFYNVSMLPQLSERRGEPLSPLLSEALQYINAHLTTLRGIEEIAEHLFISEGYLFRIFRRELRQTPHRYVLDKRLLMAERMIREGERPTEVCRACGFGDYTAFWRNYRAYFGRRPGEREGAIAK